MARRYIRWVGPDGLLVPAAGIVRSYDTKVTLRQLFYRLVAAQLLPNTQNYYRTLSKKTAEGRREGTFPDLLDRTSRVEEYQTFEDPEDALDWLLGMYRVDRTEGQEWQVWLGVEKAGLSEQLDAWFTDTYGIPHIALGGYASQTLCSTLVRRLSGDGRPAVLIYAGDHDPSGEDIDRDFQARVGFDKVIRVALNPEQLDRYNIPPNVLDESVEKKLKDDPRAAGFVDRHGYLDQYEVDALDPNLLRDLYWQAISDFLDMSIFEDVIGREDADRSRIREWIAAT